ncbi:citrate/2-methylcitrate synthase [Shewanella sp. 0m-4]
MECLFYYLVLYYKIFRHVHPIWFALARTVGWIAHWKEMLDQPGHKISRPRQLYTGDAKREFIDLDKRG